MTIYHLFNLIETNKLTQENINQWLSENNSIDEKDYEEKTALILACRKSHYEIACLLIDNDADVNHQNIWGMTALMWVCMVGDHRFIKLLLENGANPYILNNRGYSAYDHANDDTKKLILEYHPYYLHKSVKLYINKQNKNILNIKRINIPLNKII